RWLEHCPYKAGVGGSSPSTPTKRRPRATSGFDDRTRRVAHQFADAEVTVTPSGTSTRANAIAIPEGVVNASLAVSPFENVTTASVGVSPPKAGRVRTIT